jgi:hypothetical protein
MSLTRSDRLYIKKTLTAEIAEGAERIYEFEKAKKNAPAGKDSKPSEIFLSDFIFLCDLCDLCGEVFAVKSNIHNFNLRVGHLGQVGVFDEIHHLIQNGVDPLPVIGNGADPQHRLLPQILILYLGDGDVEPLPSAGDEAFDHLPFPLEGKISVQQEFQVAKPDDHGFTPPSYKWAVTFSTT